MAWFTIAQTKAVGEFTTESTENTEKGRGRGLVQSLPSDGLASVLSVFSVVRGLEWLGRRSFRPKHSEGSPQRALRAQRQGRGRGLVQSLPSDGLPLCSLCSLW